MLKKYIKNEILRNVVEWILSVGVALVILLVIDSFVFKFAKIYGPSMEPTYQHNDRVVINRMVYYFSDPKYGDIIAFPYKADPSQHYVKRVIGVPGDEINFVDGYFFINGEMLFDDFTQGTVGYGTTTFPLIVEEGSYFVLGDNRSVSEDSRYKEVGCIPKSEIIGKVSFRFFPFSKFGFVK